MAHQERKKRQAMRRELDELKEEFAKLKGMVCLAVAALNLQNNSIPTENIIDVFNHQIVGDIVCQRSSSRKPGAYPCSWPVVRNPSNTVGDPTKSKPFAASPPI